MVRAVVLLLPLTVACVGKSKYEALKTDYDTLVEENRSLANDLQSCATELKAAAAACEEPMQGDEGDEEGAEETPRRPSVPPGPRARGNR